MYGLTGRAPVRALTRTGEGGRVVEEGDAAIFPERKVDRYEAAGYIEVLSEEEAAEEFPEVFGDDEAADEAEAAEEAVEEGEEPASEEDQQEAEPEPDEEEAEEAEPEEEEAEWPLDMAPGTYLKRYPEGDHADTAREVLRAEGREDEIAEAEES